MDYFIPHIHRTIYASALPYMHQLMRQLGKESVSFSAQMHWFLRHQDLEEYRRNRGNLTFKMKDDGMLWTDSYVWCHYSDFERYMVYDKDLLALMKAILKAVTELETERDHIVTMIEYAAKFKFEMKRRVLTEMHEPPAKPEQHVSRYVPPPPLENGLQFVINAGFAGINIQNAAYGAVDIRHLYQPVDPLQRALNAPNAE